MQKSLLTLMLVFITASLFSQSIDDIRKYAVLQKWEDAKAQVDKYLSVEKNQKKQKVGITKDSSTSR